MVHRLYCVFDRVAVQSGPVFQAVNDGVASRAMAQLLEKVPAYDHDAYRLFYVGTFDDEKMLIKGDEPEQVEWDIPRFADIGGVK